MESLPTHDALVSVEYRPLDGGLKETLERVPPAFILLLNELLVCIGEDQQESDGLNLMRWAVLYATVLRDLSRSAIVLLNDGSHSRAAIMLRRVSFEYFTRFQFMHMHPEHATTAMGDFRKKSEVFEKRVGSDQVTFTQDPNFDLDRYQANSKAFPNFEGICNEVHGERGQAYYALFFSYPSALLHGDAMMSMDVLKTDTGKQRVYLDSARPYTNEIAGNFIAFTLGLALDAALAFSLESRKLLEEIMEEFNERRIALSLLDRIEGTT